MSVPPSVIIGGATGALGAAFLLTRNGVYMPVRHRTPAPPAPGPSPLPPTPPPIAPGPTPGPTPPTPPTPPEPPPIAPGPEPAPEPDPDPKPKIEPFGGGQPSLDDYPWGEPTIYTHTSVTPSTIYQVKQGDTNAWIVRQASGAALALAGRNELVQYMNPNNPGYSEPWAKALRGQMRDALICGWFNDTTYGQVDPQKAGSQLAMGPQGRGLNYRPRHADNIARLIAGKPTRRTTTINGNRQAGIPTQDSSTHMALWIPAPNLAALQGAKEAIAFVFDLQWSNGTFTINPPPPVTDPLGIEDAIFVAGGCPGWDQ